jgi:hypothetical protein
MTSADEDQPATALRALLVVGDRLVGEDAVVRARDPGRGRRAKTTRLGIVVLRIRHSEKRYG